MYKLFLTLRYLRKRRIAISAVVSVWLCVAMEVIVISVMGGFLDTIKERSRGLLSDIVIDNATLQGFPYYQEFAEHLRQEMPDQIEAVTPVIYNYGLLRLSEGYTKPVRAVGIRLREYASVNDFAEGLYYDKYYPGTTSLALQRQPVAGFSPDGVPVLPEVFETALARYRSQHPGDDEIADMQRSPGSLYPGPGEWEHAFEGPPGWFPQEGGEAPGIIVGTNIINDRSPTGETLRYVKRGEKVSLTLLPITPGGRVSAEAGITVVTRFADDSSTGVYEIDNLCVYVDFDHLQKWLAMTPQELESGGMAPARASQLLVSLAAGVELTEARRRISRQWNAFRDELDPQLRGSDAYLLNLVTVETWEERQRPFINAVEKEKILVTLLFAVISSVAVVLIACIFWMIVTQKTRDIGIIKSVGASSGGVWAIFVGFGAAVGILGAVLGSATGAVFVFYINEIQAVLESLHPQLRVWSPDVYTFDRIPNVVKWYEVLAISVAAVLASVAAAKIPAILAARVWPAKSLRYE